MRILVTGGAGFIGSNFVHRTLDTRPDYKVTVFDALTYAGRLSNLEGASKFGSRYSFLRGDIRDFEAVNLAVERADVVVHFAAESHNDNSLSSPGDFLTTNVAGTFNLIQAATRGGKRFHHISTDEVFGDFELGSTEKFSESSPYNPSSPYSATKASSDMLVRAWARSFGLRATISNCSNNYGNFQHEEKLIPRTVLLASQGIKPKVYGTGLNIRDWIHVDDHTDGILAILERGRIGETYLLGASNERTNLSVVTSILRILGLKDDFYDHIADRPGHDRRYAIDASKAKSELGWLPRHSVFEQSLAGVVEHYSSLDTRLLNLKADGHSSTIS